jgi:hypothetical protein
MRIFPQSLSNVSCVCSREKEGGVSASDEFVSFFLNGLWTGIEKHNGKTHDGVIQRQFPDEYAREGIEKMPVGTMHTQWHRPGARGRSTSS